MSCPLGFRCGYAGPLTTTAAFLIGAKDMQLIELRWEKWFLDSDYILYMALEGGLSSPSGELGIVRHIFLASLSVKLSLIMNKRSF
jgi:hypothetical protein